MLILAGVAIATLFSDNGIINRTISAKNSTDIAGAKEELEIAVESLKIDKISKNLGGTIAAYVESHQADFKKALGNDNVNIENGIITYKEKNFDISENGELTLRTSTSNDEEPDDIQSISTEALQGMIGKTVNYTGYSSSYDGGWRLFYADNDYAYIISTETIEYGSFSIPLSNKTPTTVMAEGTYGGTWNSMWLNYSGCITNQNRHKAVTYLCDSENWTSYVATNAPAGTKAYGGPTIQLFIASYNLTHEESEMELELSDITEYGYLSSDYIDDYFYSEGQAGALYANGDESEAEYYLASPTGDIDEDDDENCLICTEFHNNEFDYKSYDFENGYRPIISIPRAKIQENVDGVTLDVIMQN